MQQRKILGATTEENVAVANDPPQIRRSFSTPDSTHMICRLLSWELFFSP